MNKYIEIEPLVKLSQGQIMSMIDELGQLNKKNPKRFIEDVIDRLYSGLIGYVKKSEEIKIKQYIIDAAYKTNEEYYL